MKHLGDITRIHGAAVPLVEVIVGGSPCQDLSVAGKRAGLAGERSGLFMDQIRIIREMRDYDKRVNARSDTDARPRYMVWENVPGAFSSAGGEDFRAVLEEIAHVRDKDAVIPRPENGKWKTAGCIMADGWSIAWRVLDAQFWGVPQRRRRIALVADLGGESAPEVLFERESLRGDSQTGRTPWEGTAADAEGSAGTAILFVNRGHYRTDDVSETLRSACHQNVPCAAIGFKPRQSAKARLLGCEMEKAPSLETSQNAAICIQGNCIDRADTAGCNGKGWRDDDVSFTLNTIDRPAVYACSSKQQSLVTSEEVANSLGANDYKEPQCAYDARGNGDGKTAPTLTGDHQNRVTDYTAITYQKTTGPLMANSHPGSYTGQDAYNDMFVVCEENVCAVDCRDGVENPDVNGTLQAKSSGGLSLNLNNTIREHNAVRRLTPLECERLQGYPDGWTDIGEYIDSKGKKKASSDTVRYKALGNSIALPPWRFVLSRINERLTEHTMASLFDGIGGFPLIWRELNGPGKCLWASEIEDFPIAVTKVRFEEE